MGSAVLPTLTVVPVTVLFNVTDVALSVNCGCADAEAARAKASAINKERYLVFLKNR